MEKEHQETLEEKQWETPEDYWKELMKMAEEDDPAGVEYLLLHRGNVKDAKVPGEEELYAWLQGRAENKLGRKLQVELNESGIIVPIEAEKSEK